MNFRRTKFEIIWCPVGGFQKIPFDLRPLNSSRNKTRKCDSKIFKFKQGNVHCKSLAKHLSTSVSSNSIYLQFQPNFRENCSLIGLLNENCLKIFSFPFSYSTKLLLWKALKLVHPLTIYLPQSSGQIISFFPIFLLLFFRCQKVK